MVDSVLLVPERSHFKGFLAKCKVFLDYRLQIKDFSLVYEYEKDFQKRKGPSDYPFAG